jgi:dipeptidyl aminopeptidase/acylaminoacyl peptidase
VKGYLAVPKRGDRLPCLIFNRGGNRGFGALTDGYAAMVLGKLATWGYVVAASQYRGNAGGEGREEFGGADLQDVLHLIPLLESLPQADTSRLGMYGWSRGGLMTYLALTKTTASARRSSAAGCPMPLTP